MGYLTGGPIRSKLTPDQLKECYTKQDYQKGLSSQVRELDDMQDSKRTLSLWDRAHIDYGRIFPKLRLSGNKFKFPGALSDTFRERNPGRTIEFLGFNSENDYLRDEIPFRLVALYDPLITESIPYDYLPKGERFRVVLDNNGLLNVDSQFEYLGLTNKITVEGSGQVVVLWNPKDFKRYSKKVMRLNKLRVLEAEIEAIIDANGEAILKKLRLKGRFDDSFFDHPPCSFSF